MPSVFAKSSPRQPTLALATPAQPTLHERPGPSVFRIEEAPTLQGPTGRTGEMPPSVFRRAATEPTLHGAPQPLRAVTQEMEPELAPGHHNITHIARSLGLPVQDPRVFAEFLARLRGEGSHVPAFGPMPPMASAAAVPRIAPPLSMPDPGPLGATVRGDLPLALRGWERSNRTARIPALADAPLGSSYTERTAADETDERERPTGFTRALPWLAAAGVAGLAGLGTYAGMRRFKWAPSARVRQVQRGAAGRPLTISDRGEPTRAETLLGNNPRREALELPHLQDEHGFAIGDMPKERYPGAVLTYAPTVDRAAIVPDVGINFGPAVERLGHKGTFARTMIEQGSGSAIPHTRSVADLVAEAERQGLSLFKTRPNTAPKPEGYDKWNPAKQRLRWRAEEHGVDPDVVTKLLGHDDWYIKPTEAARENAARDFISPRDNHWHREHIEEMRAHPESFIAQQKIPIKHEYRVHTLDDQPFEYLHRRAPSGALDKVWDWITKRLGAKAGGAALPVLSPAKREALRAFVQEHMSKLKLEPGEHLHQGIDVAELPDGTFKFIESNPLPATHQSNPFVSEQLQRLVSGRWSPRVARAGALGVGSAVGLGGLGVAAVTRHKEQEDER